MVNCIECGMSAEVNEKFCSNCGSKLSGEALNVNIQDSIIQKKYDNRIENTVIDNSTNINTDSINVYLSKENDSPNVDESLKNGFLMFKNNNFSEATGFFSEVLRFDSFNSMANLYLGLSMMDAKNAMAIPRNQIKMIENCFMMALDDDETRTSALLGLAALKHDYYIAAGNIEKSPKYNEIKNELINKTSISARDIEIMNYINASDDLQDDLFDYLG
ncbi:zinc ribbon domain-containing protein [bacterium]|nr:zinc ribbon domain-containing protein [bacterium]